MSSFMYVGRPPRRPPPPRRYTFTKESIYLLGDILIGDTSPRGLDTEH